MLALLKERNEIFKKMGEGVGRQKIKRRIQKESLEGIFHFLIFRLMSTDAIQTTYIWYHIQSVQRMFPFTSVNSSLSHITNNYFSYKTNFLNKLSNDMSIFLLCSCYFIQSVTFKEDIHFY